MLLIHFKVYKIKTTLCERTLTYLKRLDFNDGLAITPKTLDEDKMYFFQKIKPFWFFRSSCQSELQAQFLPDHNHLLLHYTLDCPGRSISTPISIFELSSKKFVPLTKGEKFSILE